MSVGRRLARGIVTLLAGMALLVVLALRVDDEVYWQVELLRYLPFPVFLLPSVVGLLASLWLGWVWRWLALLTFVGVTTNIMGLVWGSADSGHGRLRVMTYNVKAYKAIDKPLSIASIAAEIAWHAPDILVMQDAGRFAGIGTKQLRELGVIPVGHEIVALGQYVITSRYPLRNCYLGNMSFRSAAHQYMHCSVLVGERMIDVITPHFLSPRKGLNATRHELWDGMDDWLENYNDRLAQAHALADVIASIQRPLIVAGDLNAPEQSPVVQKLIEVGLRDAYSNSAFGYGYTVGHALRPGVSLLRIDHILISSELGVASAEVGGKLGSEHRPVIADLLLHRAME